MKLAKLTIVAFSDNTCRDRIDSFRLQINPESYRHGHSTTYASGRRIEAAGQTTKFAVMAPQTVSFDFYLDYTGTVPGTPGLDNVAAAIRRFKDLVYGYNGKIHSPNYLKLFWGSMQFKCRLTSVNVEYTLFKPDGAPLRAKLSVAFEQYLHPDELIKLARKSSPDLSHERTVVAGDTLPLLCNDIYGSPDYYIQVAQYNRLVEFRHLAVGTVIRFPPMLGD
jgi:hypothetical protein